MAEHRPIKRIPARRSTKVYDALAALDCELVDYEFTVDSDVFDLDRFLKETSLPAGYKQWSAIFYAKRRTTGYHVHFDGRVRGKEITLSLKYYGRSVSRPKEGVPPSEEAMAWIGSFFKQTKAPAFVTAHLSKSNSTWRSRFNLPFKVTMAGSKTEVVIDGISMFLPKNTYGAMRGWLNKLSAELAAGLMLIRTIDFARFRVEDEVRVYNEAVRMFVEESRP